MKKPRSGFFGGGDRVSGRGSPLPLWVSAISFLGEILDRAFLFLSFLFLSPLRNFRFPRDFCNRHNHSPENFASRNFRPPPPSPSGGGTRPLRGLVISAKSEILDGAKAGENWLSNFRYLRKFHLLVFTSCQIFIPREILTYSTKF